MDDDFEDNDDLEKKGQLANAIESDWKKDRRPDFLNNIGGKKGTGSSKSAGSSLKGAEAAKNSLAKSEQDAAEGGGFYNRSKKGVTGGSSQARNEEENPSGFGFTGGGKKKSGIGKAKFGIGKKSAAIVVFLIILVLAAVVMVGLPMYIIGNWDFNLMKAFGYDRTVEVLEKQARLITGDDLSRGEVPDVLAGKLAAHGFTVGQVATNGDFVRTNVYVADAEKLKDMAVVGNFQVQPSEGELAVLFDGEVVSAENFVDTVESDPQMYMAFSEMADIGALYYYKSDEVLSVFKDSGLSRSMYASETPTGNDKKDMETYLKLTEKGINKFSEMTVGGYTGATTDDQGNVTTPSSSSDAVISGKEDAGEIIEDVTSATTAGSTKKANEKSAQLLNAAVTAGEPYVAMGSFLAIESPLQQTRINGDGFAHQVMAMAEEKNEVTYTDVYSHKKETIETSILESSNMQATVSDREYSKEEAANFSSQDRIILSMNMSDAGTIKDTAVGTDGQKKSDVVLGISGGSTGNADDLKPLERIIDVSMITKPSEALPSIVGANRIVNGGANLRYNTDRKAVGAMPSDAKQVAEYHQETDKYLAKRAEMERATKSPFDISSPYTFLGSIVRKMSNSVLKSKSSNNGSLVGTIASLTEDSVRDLSEGVIADGDDGSFEITSGDYCKTVKNAAKVDGDINCAAKHTLSTGYMERGKDYWKKIEDDEGLKDFIVMATDRKATVGVKSAEVCKKYKEKNNNGLDDFLDFLANLVGTYEVCDGVPNEVRLGSKWTFSDSNDDEKDAKKYAGFLLFDQASSLLEERTSKASEIRKEYYAKHPQDNSRAGFLAEISGMTKSEAELALAYGGYLAYLSRYNPAERYAFGTPILLELPERPLIEHSNQLASEMYVVWHGRTEYDDLRGRTRVA